jgi:hypothetical protein
MARSYKGDIYGPRTKEESVHDSMMVVMR